MTLASPTKTDIARLQARVESRAPEKEAQDNFLYAELFNRNAGFYSDSPKSKPTWKKTENGWERTRRRMRRREWIERYFTIRDKDGNLHPMILNAVQRLLEAWILRMERAKVPVRIQTLKARQFGISTFVQAFMFECMLRGDHVRALIVADTNERSKILLQIADVARRRMKKTSDKDGEPVYWDFDMDSKATASLVWAEPIKADLRITSAETDAPGRGGTRTLCHLSESAWWKDSENKQAGVMSSLPTRPGTYGFDESTANGDSGRFRDDFWASYNHRHVPLRERTNPWHALFFAWWQHDEYRWTQTYGAGRQMPAKMVDEITKSLDEEEKWLLQQKYLRRWRPDDKWMQVPAPTGTRLVMEGTGKEARIADVLPSQSNRSRGEVKLVWRRVGVGWREVDYDQLAWRRSKIQDKDFSGDVYLFNQEYPSRPEVAFLASGRPVFSAAILDEMQQAARQVPPIFRGALRYRPPR